jgi:hypothetical protein
MHRDLSYPMDVLWLQIITLCTLRGREWPTATALPTSCGVRVGDGCYQALRPQIKSSPCRVKKLPDDLLEN